jgi:hypothetical protein
MNTGDRELARFEVAEIIDAVLEKWESVTVVY